MFYHKFASIFLAFTGALASVLAVSAQITVDGVADKANYNDSVTYRVQTQSGFSHAAFLNGQPVTVGVFNPITRPDYYELFVHQTNDTTSAVATRLVRFLVNASQRAGTEWGLPPQTPFPLVQSSPAEFSGGSLRIMAPQDFPAGYEIPVVAWVMDDNGHPLRANGQLASAGYPAIQVRRGVGSGFLAATNPAGSLLYTAGVGGLVANKTINLEGSTTWTAVTGVLGNTTWPAGSRIHVTGNLTVPAGVTLTVEAGTVVRLNGGIDITNNGTVVINGTFFARKACDLEGTTKTSKYPEILTENRVPNSIVCLL